MERENAELLGWVYAVEGENVKLLKRPSTSSASKFSDLPRERYEEWILAEAQIEVVREMGQTGFVFETTLDEAEAKTRESLLACGYDPNIPQPDGEDSDKEYVDQLEGSAWCDSAYSQDEDGEGGGD